MGYLVAGLSASVVTAALPAGIARDVLYLVVALSGPVVMVVGTRWHRPAAPAAWYLIAAGTSMWTLGNIVRRWLPDLLGQATADVVGDVLYLATYPLVVVAVLRVAGSRSAGRGDPMPLLDTAILTLGVGMVAWVVQIEPMWAAGAVEPQMLLSLAWPVGNTVLLGAVVWLAQAPGAGRAAAHVVAVLLGAMMISDLVAAAAAPGAWTAPRPEVFDVRWLAAFPMAAAAALHPSMRTLTAPAKDTALRRATPVVQVLWLFGAMTAGPAVLLWQLGTGRPPSVASVALLSCVVTALVALRTLVMVRRMNGQASTDDLTGLPNRRALQAAARSRLADRRTPHALLLLDLDRFKEINDSLGHHVGDELLVKVAARLRDRLRDEDVLARLGGDEFAVLLEGARLPDARRVASSLVDALAGAFELGEFPVRTSASIGVAAFPEHGSDLSTLLRKADAAMYQAKGRGPVRVHGDDAELVDGLRLAEDLPDALAGEQLELHYQPKVDLASGAVTGVEALVRWRHPERGLLYPGAFLERVEEAGLMPAMNAAVLGIALDQCAAWRATGLRLRVAVNLSASSLVDLDLPAQVARLLRERGLDADALQLEITEEFLMADLERARAILEELTTHGVAISVDDFGTGYSSLAHLRDLPVDELKLDRSFVTPMAEDPRAAALVASTVVLAHSLGLRMVAEGVEDAWVCAELGRLGCDEAQGFHLCRPVPAAELEAWLDARAEAGDVVAVPTPRVRT